MTAVNITEMIAARPMGRLQVRIALLCAFIALLDGFDLSRWRPHAALDYAFVG